MVHITFDVDEIVGLMTESSAVVSVPGGGAQQWPHMAEAPAGFFLDLARECLKQGFSGLDMAADDVPGVGEEAAVWASLLGEGFTAVVEDDGCGISGR